MVHRSLPHVSDHQVAASYARMILRLQKESRDGALLTRSSPCLCLPCIGLHTSAA